MKFGVRECCDVVLRAKAAQKIGNKIFYKNEPVCYFDTLKTSTLEGAATTVYAQGGRGNARLMSWDGERTVTFTMEDALISPVGLSILTGAGLIEATADAPIYQHITETIDLQGKDDFNEGKNFYLKLSKEPYQANKDLNIYVMGLDSHGEVITEPYLYKKSTSGADTQYGIELAKNFDYTVDGVSVKYSGVNEAALAPSLEKFSEAEKVLVDYYTEVQSGAFQVDITPDKFGGAFYLEASTLWRDQGTGRDLPAEFIIPNCRVQSNFTFTMASSGDPSSFTFTMDAFPDYTRYDATEKVLARIQVIGATDEGVVDIHRTETWSKDQNNIVFDGTDSKTHQIDDTKQEVTFNPDSTGG